MSAIRKPKLVQTIVHIQATIQWLVAYDRDASEYVAVCPPLNLNAIGETYGDLQECISEVLTLLFTDLFKTGELEAFLRANGWTSSPVPPTGKVPRFDVPFTTRMTDNVQELVTAR